MSVQEGAASGYDLLTGYTHDDAAGFVYLNFLGFPGLEDFINLAATQVRKWGVLFDCAKQGITKSLI